MNGNGHRTIINGQEVCMVLVDMGNVQLCVLGGSTFKASPQIHKDALYQHPVDDSIVLLPWLF